MTPPSITFFGCLPRGQSSDPATECLASPTMDSTDVTHYRHFAVDDDADVVYLCDLQPYRQETDQAGREAAMACFALVKEGGKRKWTGMCYDLQQTCDVLKVRYPAGLEIVHQLLTNANGVTVIRSLFLTIIANDVPKQCERLTIRLT